MLLTFDLLRSGECNNMCLHRLDVTVYWRSSASKLPIIFIVRSTDKVEAGEEDSTAVHDVSTRRTCHKRWQRTDFQASRQEVNDCELLRSAGYYSRDTL